MKNKDSLVIFNRSDTVGYILLPSAFRKYFEGKRVKILFDPETNQIALEPSLYNDDYPTSRWRVWCSEFFSQYNIFSQKVVGKWDKKQSYLICTVNRKP